MATTKESLARTLHFVSDDVPFVPVGGGLNMRVLHARPEEGFVVTQIRAEPGGMSALHRHLSPVFGYTTVGAWGHNRKFEYRPGVYIFETPGVIHRFLNGPDISEATFINHGTLEMIDPESHEVTQVYTLEESVAHYFKSCEETGVPRPNILT